MNCSYCNKPIVLIPSAKERADKYGGKASEYTKLFTMHSQCQVAKRNQQTSELINH